MQFRINNFTFLKIDAIFCVVYTLERDIWRELCVHKTVSNIQYAVLAHNSWLLRSFTVLFLLVISLLEPNSIVSLFIFLLGAKHFFLSSNPTVSQLSICYEGELLTDIDSKRYSQEKMGKLENFHQSRSQRHRPIASVSDVNC